jgi:enoyl-CoA hydratase/carnithine racemase
VDPGELKVTRYGVDAAVATITLDRPDRLNAWTGRMNTEYRWLLARAATDPAVRVIVVTGAGRGFCAGADTRALEGHVDRGGYDPGTGPGLASPGYGVRPEFDAEFAYHFGIPKPVIAAVNGPAAGAGFALACYCDLRFAAAGAKLTAAHGRLGLPAEFGLSWLLPRLVGLTRAADVLLSSRVLLAEEAFEIGLVNRVVPAADLMAAVVAYARVLATEVSPASMAATKLQLYTDLHRDAATSARHADATMRDMMTGPDFAEGVAALAGRRPPRFGELTPPAREPLPADPARPGEDRAPGGGR